MCDLIKKLWSKFILEEHRKWRTRKMDIATVAEACYEVNRILCESQGDMSQPRWVDAADWQVESVVDGVEYIIANPLAHPCDSHENWLRLKTEEGWVYGEIKDTERKRHPCIVPYDQLPASQKLKDHLFTSIVKTFITYTVGEIVNEINDAKTDDVPNAYNETPPDETGENQAEPAGTPEPGDEDA